MDKETFPQPPQTSMFSQFALTLNGNTGHMGKDETENLEKELEYIVPSEIY